MLGFKFQQYKASGMKINALNYPDKMVRFKYTRTLIFIITLLFPAFMYASNWSDATAKKVREMYPIEKSKNPAASAEFLKAMEYRIYIEELHPTMDYDNPVMLKLIRQMDEHFQKGKKLLPKNSVEDIVWWVLFYKDIYGLIVPPRNDYSLAYENLPYQEFAQKHDEILQMIERYPYGIVNFNLPEIKRFRFQAMAALVSFYSGKYPRRYPAQHQDYYLDDPQSVKNLSKVLKHYEVVKNKYLLGSKFVHAMTLSYSSDMVDISSELIKIRMYHTQNQQFLPEMCTSNEAIIIKDNLPVILDSMKIDNYQTNVIYSDMFDKKHTNNPALFKLLARRCPNLNPDMQNAVAQMNHLIKTKGKK